jgi:hypothetical protein
MADAPGRQEIAPSIDGIDLMRLAAAEGYLIRQHILEGGEVILINSKTNEMRMLVKTERGFEVVP